MERAISESLMGQIGKKFEERIKKFIKPPLERGRGGDWEHTLRAVEYGRYLLQHEKGEREIVIPTLYLHDIGWSKVLINDFMEASPGEKRQTESASRHMKYGALLAKDILRELGYRDEWSRRIISIIAIHDNRQKVFKINDSSAIIVFEADRLDRYGPESFHRFSAMFGPAFMSGEHKREASTYLRNGLKRWFKTGAAKTLAMKLAREQGLFD
jgi:HD superfamily phosphodiesterase